MRRTSAYASVRPRQEIEAERGRTSVLRVAIDVGGSSDGGGGGGGGGGARRHNTRSIPSSAAD